MKSSRLDRLRREGLFFASITAFITTQRVGSGEGFDLPYSINRNKH